MPKPPSPLSRSVEDYLKAVFHLTDRGDPASTTALASALNVAPPSVSGMIKRLGRSGLLEHLPYRGVRLTARGRRGALRILRRHRIIEAYLVSRLGYAWDNVHDEAERLEHAVSDALVDRMSQSLGDPRFDPHGDPIPGVDGAIADRRTTPLTEVPPGETVTIARVDTGDAARLRWLADAGLIPGAALTMIELQPFGGPLTVHLNGQQQMLGRELAAQLLCTK